MKKIRRRLIFLVLLSYAFYVIGTTLFLNTSIFQKVADMRNQDQTFISLHAAISPFPGLIYIESAHIFIADQNVSIPIDLNQIWVRFGFLPFFRKQLEIEALTIGRAKAQIGLKTEAESTNYQKKYATLKDVNLKERAKKVAEYEKDRLGISIQKITIKNISEVKNELGDFHGNLSLEGAFFIQPGVQAEVFPTTLHFKSGSMENQFSDVEGLAHVKIDRFKMINAPGNAVFPYFNADLKLNIGLESLKLLNLTLRRIPGYEFQGGARLKIQLSVVKGLLQVGSQIETSPARLLVKTPSLTAHGTGLVKWWVVDSKISELTCDLNKIQVRDEHNTEIVGSVKNANLKIRVYGNDLVNAFHDLGGSLKLRALRYEIGNRGSNPNLRYHGRIVGNGELSGFTADVPRSEKNRDGTVHRLRLNVEHLSLHTSFLSDLTGQGRLLVNSLPLDFTDNSILFPEVSATLDLAVGDFGQVKTKAIFKNLKHQLSPNEGWKGEIEWGMNDTGPFVDYLRSKDKLGMAVGALARVKNFKLKMEWENSGRDSWLRFNQISSDGLWNAYGTLLSDRRGVRGSFEAEVMNVPIGIRIQPEKTDMRLFPSAEWYDESQPDLLPGVQ